MSARLRGRSIAAATATIGSAACFAASGSLHPWWPAAWLAPVLVVAFAVHASARAAFGAAFLARFAGGFALYSYFRGQLGMPLPIILIVFAAPAIVFGLSALLVRALARRVSPVTTAALAAAAAAAADHLRTVTSVHGTFGSVAYSQIDALPIARLASIGGLPLIVFMLTLASTTAALAVARVGAKSERSRAGVIATISLFFSLILPIALDRHGNVDGRTIKVALLARDVPPFPISLPEPGARDAVDAYAHAIE
ncbi:MAG: hypothetical protein ACHREM_32320, partial [Polyangiales bacterium]